MKTKSEGEASSRKTQRKRNQVMAVEKDTRLTSPSVEEVRELAYLIFHDRISSGVQSNPEEDWFIAESILNNKKE